VSLLRLIRFDFGRDTARGARSDAHRFRWCVLQASTTR
jgi:hypothetical protein